MTSGVGRIDQASSAEYLPLIDKIFNSFLVDTIKKPLGKNLYTKIVIQFDYVKLIQNSSVDLNQE